MRKFCLGLAGLAAVAGLVLAPAAAQASPSSHVQAAAAAARHVTSSRPMRLSAKQCAALRKAERGKSASCLAHEVVHLTAQRRAAGPDAAAASTFYKGYAVACGGTIGGPCESWRAELHVQFTTSGDDAWVNGFDPSTWCSTSGTPQTLCKYVNNGTDDLYIEIGFGSDGYLGWDVVDGFNVVIDQPSWANSGAFCAKVNNGCYS
jgi:hypothetical protein